MILRSYLPKGMRSESSRGHERTLVPSRELVAIRVNTTVRRQVEERIIVTVTMIIALPTWPALVRFVGGVFHSGSGPNVDFDDAIEEFTGCALDCPMNSLTVALSQVPGTESSLLLGGT